MSYECRLPPEQERAAARILIELSARVAPRTPAFRTFYDRNRKHDKRHTQALIALVQRRVGILRAMIHGEKGSNPPKPLDINILPPVILDDHQKLV